VCVTFPKLGLSSLIVLPRVRTRDASAAFAIGFLPGGEREQHRRDTRLQSTTKFHPRDHSERPAKEMHDARKASPLFTPADLGVNRRESDSDEPCDHRNARGSKYQSRHCPQCGQQLLTDVESDAQERFNEKKRSAIENNYRVFGAAKGRE